MKNWRAKHGDVIINFMGRIFEIMSRAMNSSLSENPENYNRARVLRVSLMSVLLFIYFKGNTIVPQFLEKCAEEEPSV